MNAAATIGTTRHLTFEVDGQLYALPADAVAEVLRVPPLARVPQGPRALLGVANLRGAVLPVVSLHVLLGIEPPQRMPDSAIVLDIGAPVMLVVDSIARLHAPAAGDLTARDDAAGDAGRFTGAFAVPGTQQVARVLDIRALLDGAFARRARAVPQATAHAADLRVRRLTRSGDARQMLVTFEVASQEYALPLAEVQEILPAPAHVTALARSDTAVLGLTAVRDRLLPLLSLRALLGFDVAADARQRQKVVVVKVGDTRVGLVADRARAILAAEPEQVDPVPPVLASRTGGESRVRAIYRAEGGTRLVSILAADQVFRKDVMQQLTDTPRGTPAADASQGADAGRELIFLVFRLGEDEFGLPIDTVVEVAQVPEQITRIPRTPRFLEGVVNLRGEVLPIVDQRRRFEMPPRDTLAGRRLVVVKTSRHRAGLIVDAVHDVLRVRASQVAPPPELTDATSRLVHGVLNLESDRRLVLLLDPAELLTRAEQGLLDTFQASRKKANA